MFQEAWSNFSNSETCVHTQRQVMDMDTIYNKKESCRRIWVELLEDGITVSIVFTL